MQGNSNIILTTNFTPIVWLRLPLHSYFISHQVYRNNESVTPNPRSPLEDYSLHIIDLHTGRLCDTRSFKCDKIILSHNQGLYLYRNILAVLSVQQQTIHVFQVSTFAI